MRSVLILLAAALGIDAQSSDWEKLQELAPHQRISMRMRDGSWVSGRFGLWDPSAIEMTNGRRISRAETERVVARTKGSRWKAALVGAAVGFAIPFPFGVAKAGFLTDQNNPRVGTRLGVGAGLGLLGAGIGSAIGAVTGGTRDATVFRADGRGRKK